METNSLKRIISVLENELSTFQVQVATINAPKFKSSDGNVEKKAAAGKTPSKKFITSRNLNLVLNEMSSEQVSVILCKSFLADTYENECWPERHFFSEPLRMALVNLVPQRRVKLAVHNEINREDIEEGTKHEQFFLV